MRVLLTALAAVGIRSQSCVITAGDRTFDFTSLAAKQLPFNERNYNYVLTLCQTAPEPCGGTSSSLCQSDEFYQFNLGVWHNFSNWRLDESSNLVGSVSGEVCPELGIPRYTDITFQCGPEAKILSMDEVLPCKYKMVVQVPDAVCSRPCCAPATYTSTRFEIGGAQAVVQRSSSGDWFDGNYQGRGQSLLCSAYYQRCFTFSLSQATCVGSAYRAAPVQCFGPPDWRFKAQLPAINDQVLQTIWVSTLDQNYVATASLDGSSSCVAVSGSGIDTSAGFSVTPNATLWVVPPICLKEMGEWKKKQRF